MQNNPKINIFLSILILVVAGLGIWLVLARTPAPAPIEIPESNVQETSPGVFTYRNVDLGFEFQYPSALGSVELRVVPGETGREFDGSVGNGIIRFGGLTQDFSAGREGDILDFRASDYERMRNYYPPSPQFIYDFVTNSGDKGIMIVGNDVNNMNDTSDYFCEFGCIERGTYAYFFKLKGSFSGVAFSFAKNDQVFSNSSEGISKQDLIMKTFKVLESTTPQPEPISTVKQCVKSGCSGQICSDHEELSNCEYKPEYACYESAKCEVQATTGECGWTETAALTQCLSKAQ
jgi:hypothetical protein